MLMNVNDMFERIWTFMDIHGMFHGHPWMPINVNVVSHERSWMLMRCCMNAYERSWTFMKCSMDVAGEFPFFVSVGFMQHSTFHGRSWHISWKFLKHFMGVMKLFMRSFTDAHGMFHERRWTLINVAVMFHERLRYVSWLLMSAHEMFHWRPWADHDRW